LEEKKDAVAATEKVEEITPGVNQQDTEPLPALTPESFEKAWKEFTDSLKGEGTRVISMFKSIHTELDEQDGITIHLTNAAQKDLFVVNYKPRLTAFLQKQFGQEGIEITTIVDLSETNEIIYSDEQKYNHMVAKYPGLKDFKKAFNLDIL